MVQFLSPKGYIMHEPPYTQAEEDDLYRRMDAGPKTVLRTSRPRLKVPLPKEPQEEPPSQ